MDALDSPLEALALNYLRLGFFTAVNNIWTWVAVVTAAVSFWRIRALSIPAKSGACVLNPVGSSPSPTPSSSPSSSSPPVEGHPAENGLTSSSSFCLSERDGRTKGKFSVYYIDDYCNDGEIDTGDSHSNGVGFAGAKYWRNDLQSEMRLRMGEMGWYADQDFTVTNGNVVRLWGR